MPHDSEPVFILSCERSGSTLLRYILDAHPDICSPGELCLGRLVRAYRFSVSRTFALAYGDPAESDRVCLDEVRSVILSLMDRFARIRQKKLWCDKSPENISFLEDLGWAFPAARRICLYRRGLDVAASCLDASRWGFMAELAPYAQRHPQNLVAAMLESWADKTETLLAFEANHEFCFRVHYEALVNDPSGTLSGICAFLGLSWDDNILERAFTQPHDAGGGDYKIKSMCRIDSSSIGRGSQIDAAVLSRIPPGLGERYCAIHLRLGYPC